MKRRIFEILEPSTPDNIIGKLTDVFILGLIILNGFAVILESMSELASYEDFFRAFEVFSVAIFTFEYGLRLWTCVLIPGHESPLLGRIRFALTPLALIDLMAILPFFLSMILPYDLRSIRLLRLIRLFRLFKLVRYSRSLKIFGNVLAAKKEEIFITLFFGFLLLII